jgi:hypothetical protein
MVLLVDTTGRLLEKVVVAMKKPEHSEMTCIKVVKIHRWNHLIVQIFPMTKREIFLAGSLVHH